MVLIFLGWIAQFAVNAQAWNQSNPHLDSFQTGKIGNTTASKTMNAMDSVSHKSWYIELGSRQLLSSKNGMVHGIRLIAGLQSRQGWTMGVGVGQVSHLLDKELKTYPVFLSFSIPWNRNKLKPILEASIGRQWVGGKNYWNPWWTETTKNNDNGWYGDLAIGVSYRLPGSGQIKATIGHQWQHFGMTYIYSDQYRENFQYKLHHFYLNLALLL